MEFPKDYRYTEDHEWAHLDGSTVTIGITHHAQSELGDIVFVELPDVGRELKKGETFGVVESIKAVSDLYAPVNGKVVEVNALLTEEPSTVNSDPHQQGWLIKLEVSDPATVNELMDATAYAGHVH